MPQRYKQGQLASPVVGTPGVDQSAGKAEAMIAQSADAMAAEQHKSAMQQLGQAEQSFTQTGNRLMYWGHQRQQAAARQAALEKAEQDEQRRLQAQFDRVDEDDRMSGVVAGLKDRFNENPALAIEAFKQQVPVLRQEFQDRHVDDEKRLRMLMPSQRQAEHGALTELQNWSRTTINQNLNKRLMLLPEELTNKISGLSGSIPEQIAGFQKAMTSTNTIYDNMRLSAVSQADHDEIYTKQLQLNHAASKQLGDHLMAQTPDGEAGIKHLDAVKGILEKPGAYGLRMAPEDQVEQLEHVHKQRTVHEQDVIVGIKSNADLNVLDANMYRKRLFDAINNPKDMIALEKQVQNKFADLSKQIAMVGKEPDSKIKVAKLAGLKSEQSALIAATGQEAKQQIANAQRERQDLLFQQGQLRFQQGQLLFDQHQDDRMQRLENIVVKEAQVAKLSTFNKEWAATQQSLRAAWGQPTGSKQQEIVGKIVQDALPKLNAAVAAGTIGPEAYGRYLDQLKGQSESASFKKTGKSWWGMGPETTRTLTGTEKQKAIDAAKAQVGAMIQAQQSNFVAMQSSYEQLELLTTSKGEKAVLTQYLSANLPRVLEADAYKKQTPEKQAAFRASFIKNAVARFRQGTLQ